MDPSTSTLYNLHIAAFVVHFASSILSFFFHLEKAQAEILVPLHTYATNEYTVTSSKVLFSFSPLVLISINEILTCLSHGIALYWLRGNLSKKDVNRREFTRRGYEYMLTAGILQCALVLGVGHAYLHDLLFLLMINVVIQLLGISIDMTKESREGTNKSMAIFWNYVMAFTLLCVEIVYVFIHCFSIEKPESFNTTFFYVMGIIYAILYLMFGVVKLFYDDDEKANKIFLIKNNVETFPIIPKKVLKNIILCTEILEISFSPLLFLTLSLLLVLCRRCFLTSNYFR